MPQVIPGTRALPIDQKGFREGYKAILRPAAQQIGMVLLRAAGSDGIIDPKREREVLTATGRIIDRVFVGSDGRHAYAENEATPLSPFATLINTWVASVTVKAVRNQQRWMKSHVPEDVFNWLSRAKRPQNVQEMIGVEARLLKGFLRDVFAEYDPLHLWVDPNGYRLSDRIWRTYGDMRARLDAMLAEQIRNGNSAFNISKMAEQFMLPGRAALRTNKPYGTDASYRGMVLGRTEISRAHGWATILSARLNPYVEGIDWMLSGSHPKLDPCDAVATVGLGGRIRDPYPVGDVPGYPMHPQCVLPGQMVTTIGGDVPIEDIQAGDLVLTHNGRYQAVQSSWHNNYDGVIYRIETVDGSMEITPEHPVMTLHGWVNAEDLQPGDYVLNTAFQVGTDSNFRVVENSPSQNAQSGITQSVFFGGVPMFPVTLDSNLMIDQCKIKSEALDPVLSDRFNPILSECDPHHLLDMGFPCVVEEAFHSTETAGGSVTGLDLETLPAIETGDEASVLQSHCMHDEMGEAGIIDFLGSRNFRADTGLPSRVCISSLTFPDLPNPFRACFTARSIVFDPLDLRPFAVSSKWNTTISEEQNQPAELCSKDAVNLRRAEHVSDIELSQDILDRSPLLSFDTFDVPSNGVKFGAFPATFPGAGLAADRTITGIFHTHDNLLSSSPECRVGAASGNAVVGRLIRPSLAQLHYIPIQSISVREYAGLVYNMHVEDDNSYTVNGMAVHNCLCNLQSVVTDTPSEVTDELRVWMESGEEPPVTPAADDTVLWLILGTAFYEWWRQNQEAVAA